MNKNNQVKSGQPDPPKRGPRGVRLKVLGEPEKRRNFDQSIESGVTPKLRFNPVFFTDKKTAQQPFQR